MLFLTQVLKGNRINVSVFSVRSLSSQYFFLNQIKFDRAVGNESYLVSKTVLKTDPWREILWTPLWGKIAEAVIIESLLICIYRLMGKVSFSLLADQPI